MKKLNYYFTLSLVLFITLFAFFNMFQIVKLSANVLTIVVENLIPSLLPFMLLISLCLSLGIVQIFSYFIQLIFTPIFKLKPIMGGIYFISFFCGYPTNFKIMKEAYELKLIDQHDLQHLLNIASFSSLSFIFISLNLKYPFIIYFCHLFPSLLMALFYKSKNKKITFTQMLQNIPTTNKKIGTLLKESFVSSCYAFIFILGYMLIFQFIGYGLSFFIENDFILNFIKGLLEFSSGTLQLLQMSESILNYASIAFILSFGSFSVFMQMDNLLENIHYSFTTFMIHRIIHGCLSFILAYFVFSLIL